MSVLFPRNARFHVATAIALRTLALTAGLVAWPLAVHASRAAPDRPLQARSQGAVLPLERLIAGVAAQLPGRLIAAELDEEDGQPMYELRWLLPDGRVLEIDIEARTGRWTALQGVRLETLWRTPAAAVRPAPPPR